MTNRSKESQPVVWVKWECEAGNRWTTVQRPNGWNETYDNKPCDFSRCECKGKVTRVGTTSDGHEASDWFRIVVSEDANPGVTEPLSFKHWSRGHEAAERGFPRSYNPLKLKAGSFELKSWLAGYEDFDTLSDL